MSDKDSLKVFRSFKQNDRQCNDQKKKNKKQIMDYQTLHGKLEIEQHEPH